MPQGVLNRYTGHLEIRNGKTGKHYQLVIEGPRNPVTGKRQRQYETVLLAKREAERLLYQRLAELNAGIYKISSPKLLSSWLEEWMDLYKRDLSPTTKADYMWRIQHYIIPELGNISINQLGGIEVQRFINALTNADHPLSGKSIRNILIVLRAALQKAVELHLISENPCDHVSLPKKGGKKPGYLECKQVESFLQRAKGENDCIYLLLLLAFSLGLRRGELVALRWNDFDLNAGTVRIHSNHVLANGRVIEKNPKSEAGVRVLALGPKLTGELKKYRNTAAGPFVISKKDGTPYNPDSLSQKFRRFLERNDLPHIRLQDTRHTNATLLCGAGVDPKTVQARLGHADISTTMNIYVHALQENSRKAAELIDCIVI